MSNLKVTIGTLANIIKHGDTLLDLLRGGTVQQSKDKLRDLIELGGVGRLTDALDAFSENLRVLKLSEPTLANEPPPQRGLDLPQWTSDHARVLDREMLRMRGVMLALEEKLGSQHTNENIAAAEVYGGLLQTLANMRKPVD